MRIGLIYEGGEPNWPVLDLQREARAQAIGLQLIRITELTAHIKTKKLEVLLRGRPPNSLAGFLVRGLGWPTNLDRMEHRFDLLHSLEATHKPVMNPPAGIILARDKERTLSVLAGKGFKVPETYVSEDLSTAMRASRRFGKGVIKPLQGSRGLGIIPVDSEDSAFHVLRIVAQTSGVFYVQRRVPNLRETLRIFVVGGKALGGMLLKPRGGAWKTNVAQGGAPAALELSQADAKLAIRATQSLGLWYAGVDMLIDKRGERFVAEVNSSPSWRTFSKVTGTNPAMHILKFLASKATERIDTPPGSRPAKWRLR